MNTQYRRLWLATALLATIMVAFTIWGVYRRPAQEEDEPENLVPRLEGVVKIGALASHWETYPVYEFLAELAMDDINAYCLDEGLNCSFEFILSSGEGTAAIALDRTQMYKEMGIDLVVGYHWSTQLCTSDSYSEENDMVLLSPASTSPVDHLTEDDNAFRMSPHDFKEAGPIASIIRSCGVDNVVVLKRRDNWGDGLSEEFDERFTEKGGNPSSIIGYAGETTSEGFRPYLEEANEAIEGIIDERGLDGAAILVICFSEVIDILERAKEFSALMDVKWFMTRGHFASSIINQEITTIIAADVGIISWSPIAPDGPQHRRVNEAFSSEFGRDIDYYEANIYDALWVMALSAIEAGETDGPSVREVLPGVAANYSGITGECSLDANGDRVGADYAIWVYLEEDGAGECVRCGTYHHDSDSVEWDEALMLRAEEPG